MNDCENTTKSFKTSCQTCKCWFACLLGVFWFLIFSKFFFKFSCLLFRFTHSKLKLQLTANLKEV